MQEFEQDAVFSFELDDDNTPKKPLISGKLTVSHSSGMNLIYSDNEVFGSQELQSKDKFYLYGQTLDGKKFTAQNCWIQKTGGSVLVSGGFTLNTTSILINKMFVGDWFKDINELKIDNINVRFSYLEEWFGGLKTEYDRDTKKFIIPLEELEEEFDFPINKRFSIRSTYTFKTQAEINEISIKFSRYLKFNFIKKECIEYAERQMFILQQLFQILLTKEKIFNEEIYFMSSGQKITIYTNKIKYTPEKDTVRKYHFLDTFDKKRTEILLKLWFEKYEAFGRVFDTLSLVLDNQAFTYTENKFLALAQWLEGFCRLKFPTTTTSKKEHKLKLESIRQNLKDETDLEYFNKLVGYPYETPFGTQLNKLLIDIEISKVVEDSEENIKELSVKIKQNRNKLTHIDKKQPFDDGLTLLYQKEFMKYLITLVMIKELQLGNSIAAEEINRHLEFSYKRYRETLNQ